MAAIVNGTPDSWRAPEEIEVHPNTDELFVLVTGRACLLMGGGDMGKTQTWAYRYRVEAKK